MKFHESSKRDEAVETAGKAAQAEFSGISRRSFLIGTVAAGLALGSRPMLAHAQAVSTLSGGVPDSSFVTPPESANVWIYWWWLNGYVTRQGILADLDAMKQQGVSGALIINAGGGPTSKSMKFMSREWRDAFRFAVEESAKRDIKLSVNLCSGWNAGGPWITASEAPQELVFSTVHAKGPALFSGIIPQPHHTDPYYQDVAVLAYKVVDEATPYAIKNIVLKAGHTVGGTEGGYPISDPPEAPGELPRSFCRSDSLTDLSERLQPDGRISWQAPEGDWILCRFGHTPMLNPIESHLVLAGPDDHGYEVDPFRADVMDKHFAATALKMLEDVRPLAGRTKTLQYFHIDSWEIGKPNWTKAFPDEFKQRRGYDLLPYMAALAGQCVDNPEVNARFLEDFNRTIGDLAIENYYGRLTWLAHQQGLDTDSESEGSLIPWEDSLRALGTGDVMMSEYWSRLKEPAGYIKHTSGGVRRWMDGIKGASSAAHAYGKPIVQGEAFTVMLSIDWSHYPFTLKDIGDLAFCAGLNRNVIQSWTHQPDLNSVPGLHWPRIGIKFDPCSTWFAMSHAWLRYLARCQHIFQRGRFTADVLYYYGGGVPNYVPAREWMAPPLPAGYDCDTINEEVLLSRLSVEDGRVRLPGGLSYRILVMPIRPWSMPPDQNFIVKEEYLGPGNGLPVGISAGELRKIKHLIENGATVLGPKPVRAPGLTGYPQSDREVQRLADEIWGDARETAGERKLGAGRVIWGKQLEDVLDADGIAPDFTYRRNQPYSDLRYIHYSVGDGEFYFISNQTLMTEEVECTFRMSGLQPELWDAVTGEIRDLPQFRSDRGRTVVPMKFAPRQSFFVVFRKKTSYTGSTTAQAENFPATRRIGDVDGPWEVSFDPRWGGPAKVTFPHLEDWTKRHEEGIRYYSGTARYSKTFDLPAGAKDKRIFLDLGVVDYLAEVHLNGKNLGVVWTAPWQVEISSAMRERDNRLEIDVVNLWTNRLIGDGNLPLEKRFTKTNVRADPGWRLAPSGLLGPVTLRS